MGVELKEQGVNVYSLAIEDNTRRLTFNPYEDLTEDQIADVLTDVWLDERYMDFYEEICMATAVLPNDLEAIRGIGHYDLFKEHHSWSYVRDLSKTAAFKLLYPEQLKKNIRVPNGHQFSTFLYTILSTPQIKEAVWLKIISPELYEDSISVVDRSTYDHILELTEKGDILTAAYLRLALPQFYKREDLLSEKNIRDSLDALKFWNSDTLSYLELAFSLSVVLAQTADINDEGIKITQPEEVLNYEIPILPHERSF